MCSREIVERSSCHHQVEGQAFVLALEAHKQPVLAQIWEQRRTTAAVVTGFATLQQAVTEMTETIRHGNAVLVAAIQQSGQTVATQVSYVTDSIEQSSQQQAQHLRTMSLTMQRSRLELEHQSREQFGRIAPGNFGSSFDL